MTTTKPARHRQPAVPVYDRNAEKRAEAHRDIDAIFDALTQAELDRDSIGYPQPTTGSHGGADPARLNPIEAAATHHHIDQATDWLAERKEALSQLYRVANQARAIWLTPAAGTTRHGITIGERTNTTETCTLCRNPVTGSRDDPIRRIDGEPFHKSPCWYTVTSDRQGRPAR